VGEQIVFGLASGAALFFGALVIGLKKPFQATVSLIGCLLAIAVLFLILSAPFVAAIQVIVYAGAIVVLFLFVIAYLGERPLPEIDNPLARYEVFGWVAILGLGAQGAVLLATSNLPGLWDEPTKPGDIGSPEAIGRSFLDDYIVPFEATSLALVVAAIGAVLLAKRAVRAEGGR
jgi:NADH-quinone oxidoreductase subunit J